MVLDQRGSKTRLILLSECWWSKVAETYECVKYLGVSIDKDLSLTTQNEHAQCRAKLALMCTLLTPACMEIIISIFCCVLGMCYLELSVPVC